MPEKSGMDAVPGAACPKPGVTAAAANVTDKRKFRRSAFMLPSLSWFGLYFV
jgi:hypothetical protein